MCIGLEKGKVKRSEKSVFGGVLGFLALDEKEKVMVAISERNTGVKLSNNRIKILEKKIYK